MSFGFQKSKQLSRNNHQVSDIDLDWFVTPADMLWLHRPIKTLTFASNLEPESESESVYCRLSRFTHPRNLSWC